jgi:hypothetical protein
MLRTYPDPNPFMPDRGEVTHFNYTSTSGFYSIRVYTIKARIVRTLQNAQDWDGRDDQGKRCESGVYVYQIQEGSQRASGTVVLLH